MDNEHEQALADMEAKKALWYEHAREAAYILSDIVTYLEGEGPQSPYLERLMTRAVERSTAIQLQQARR